MKKIGVALVMLALAMPVLAGNLDVASSGPLHQAASVGSHSRTTTVYSNLATPLFAYTTTSGATVNEVGDDLDMIGGGVLEEVTFSVWNGMSSTSPLPNQLTSADLELNFYSGVLDANNVMNYSWSGGFSLDNVALGLAPGYFTLLTVNQLQSLNIALTPNIIASLTITDLQGGSTKAGQVAYNPPTIGSSYDMFMKNGQLGWWFGGPPYIANFAWEIKVPEPAGLLLLGLAGLLIRRR